MDVETPSVAQHLHRTTVTTNSAPAGIVANPSKPSSLTSLIVIPARLGSTRLARKMLLAETGRPLIQHTYEAACRARRPGGVVVATDSDEIAAVVRGFGGSAVLTSPECASGTDRVAEVARSRPDIEIFVNVQGDEPEMAGDAIDRVIALLEEHPEAPMSTLAAPIRDRARWLDPACVKVVFDRRQRALYFSRAPIPFARTWDDRLLENDPPLFYQHLGIYAYRRSFLLELARLPRSATETVESLEQLRVLDAGYPILVGVVAHATSGIDTPSDYAQFVQRWRSSQHT
jgi:3-deoxy-manno-octulosonate cytidylyltransferase (CMP-KDO synthetase)